MKDLPEETAEELAEYRLLRLQQPHNVEEAVTYCRSLKEHFFGLGGEGRCDASGCKHMGKAGPLWVLRKLLGRNPETLKMVDICHKLTTTILFSAS